MPYFFEGFPFFFSLSSLVHDRRRRVLNAFIFLEFVNLITEGMNSFFFFQTALQNISRSISENIIYYLIFCNVSHADALVNRSSA